jgi:hypothetical protein
MFDVFFDNVIFIEDSNYFLDVLIWKQLGKTIISSSKL